MKLKELEFHEKNANVNKLKHVAGSFGSCDIPYSTCLRSGKCFEDLLIPFYLNLILQN